MDLNAEDRVREGERLACVLAEVRRQLAAVSAEHSGTQDEMVRSRRQFWDEFRINPDDAVETYAVVRQQAMLLSEGERRYRQAVQAQRNLSRLERSPYFGRVDFLADEAADADEIYVGVASLRSPEDRFLVYDWRAPISSLYYDHGPGPASYEAPAGTVAGRLQLKRQFVIAEGQIRLMFDTGITIGDQMLMQALSEHADAEMHSIVATIQREQNQVIRDDSHQLLIVLGVAGSGKTSAALQRVAYLLYRHRDSLQADQMVLFSPNPLFSSYVATVLPELGEEPIQQTTFQAYLERRLGQTCRVEDAYDQIEGVLAAADPRARSVRVEGIRYKASKRFREVLERYAARLQLEGMQFVPVRFRDRQIASPEELSARFDALGRHVRIQARVSLLRDSILEQLRGLERQERQKEWVEEEMQLLDREAFQQADLQLRRRRDSGEAFDELEAARAQLGGRIVRSELQPLKAWVRQLQFVDVRAIYLRLFRDPALLGELEGTGGVPRGWREICGDTLRRLQDGLLPQEDATPLLYLEELLRGAYINPKVRHLVVDEAQDYTPFQIEFLLHLFPAARLTLLGDPHQAVSPGLSALAETRSLAARSAPQETALVRLCQTYRSTREIVEFTRGLLPPGEEIVPFDRHGEKPRLVSLDARAGLGACVAEDVVRLQRAGHQTIAVICKTAGESEESFAELQRKLDVQLIRKDATAFSRGVLVLPGYLAKGLEFDAVIIFDASARVYPGAQERHLLYSACTRAMHCLHVYSAGSPSPLLEAVDSTTYTHTSC